MEVGQFCIKTRGHDKNRKCVVVDLKEDRVLVSGPKKITGVRRKWVNYSHIRLLPEKIEIKKGASDEDIATALGKTLPKYEEKPKKKVKEPVKKKISIFKKKEKKAAPKKKEKRPFLKKKGSTKRVLKKAKKKSVKKKAKK